MTTADYSSQFGYAATGTKVHLGFMFDGPRCVQGPAIVRVIGTSDGNRPELIAALLAAEVKPGRLCGHCFPIVVRRAYAAAKAAQADQNALPADDFTPVADPSIAAMHRQWLDRGLPAGTWADFVNRSAEG